MAPEVLSNEPYDCQVWGGPHWAEVVDQLQSIVVVGTGSLVLVTGTDPPPPPPALRCSKWTAVRKRRTYW